MSVRRVNPMAAAMLIVAAAFGSAGVARAAETPYDAMQRSFGGYLDPADSLAWPMKVRAIASDEYRFFRGTRDLFYGWTGAHCRDWLNDRAAYTVSHNDLHWGNLGSFAAEPLGTLAWGEVDFDESARLPVQIELLQGVLTFELIASENRIPLSTDDRAELIRTLFDTYADTLAGPPRELGIRALMKSRTGRPYGDEVEQFTRGGRFKSVVTKRGVTTDILRPVAGASRSAVAVALAEAVQHDARLGRLLTPFDAADFEDAILDVAVRTRVDSSGSQGLLKILVLLRRPFRGQDGDGILYLKQQIPSAPERAGIVPRVVGPAARRYVRDLDTLTHGQSLAASWCELGGRSYWVSVKEPWSAEPDSKDIGDNATLLNAARVWARIAADSHRDDAARLRPLLTPALQKAVADRAADYLRGQHNAYKEFCEDTRTQAAVESANAAQQQGE